MVEKDKEESKVAPKEKKTKKTSCYLITVNTNLRFKSKSDPKLKEWYHKLDKVALEIGKRLPSYYILKKPALDRGDKLNKQYIMFSKYQYALELGPDTGCLHYHAAITIRHKTTLSLNYEKIKIAFCDALGRNVYFQSRVASSATVNFEEYVKKSEIKIDENKIKEK